MFEDGGKELPFDEDISGTGTGFLSSSDLSDGALKIRSDESDSSPTLAVLDGNDFVEPAPKDGKTNLRLLVVTTSTLDLVSPRLRSIKMEHSRKYQHQYSYQEERVVLHTI